MAPTGDMIIFLKMVNATPMTIRSKIKGVMTGLAPMDRFWIYSALPARDGPALMTGRAEL